MRSTYYGDYSYMTRVENSRSLRFLKGKSRAKTHLRGSRKLLIVIGIIFTIILCTIFSVKTFAGTDNNSKRGEYGMKQYKSIMVYCGDTVESIAEENYSFPFSSCDRLADEIRSINHLGSDEKLIAGNYIVIPFYNYCSHSL